MFMRHSEIVLKCRQIDTKIYLFVLNIELNGIKINGMASLMYICKRADYKTIIYSAN